jgi:hypothetical protein
MAIFGKVLVLPRYYKWDVVKARQASQGLTETRQKGHWKMMLYQGGGKKNTHTRVRWTCANGEEWSRGKKEVLIIGLHMVGKMRLDLLNLETLKFLIHFIELGSSLYFIFTHTHIFFFFSFIHFFICSPWTLNCVAPTSSPMLRCLLVLGQRGDRDKVGTGNIFPLERYLKSSILSPSCDLPWIDDPYSMIGCGQGSNHKRWYLVLRVDIRRGLWDLRCGDTQCTDKRLAIR